ncbi:TRAP transporter small permease [Desulfallas sp. Bu1-1]|uniref:TRAP transporter small permease n=1 Tax=Desulfallas sp. Bu1-1 TaxID=2787620 RepID=UPI00189E61AB|nr:TRAP transporter small permease [Desulfallas sp. Bu1-1]MBF7082767.1 TRAP transporter small permease [Desulfallas sp. Bu1-1]
MKKLIYYMDNLEEIIITILLPLMCIVVFLSTFFRFAKMPLMPWGEELARYLMIWIVFLGLGTGAKKNAHFFVQLIINLVPKTFHKYVNIFRIMIVVIFCSIILFLSLSIVKSQMVMGQISPSLHIPMWIVYLAIPVGCASMALRSIQYLIKELKEETKLT